MTRQGLRRQNLVDDLDRPLDLLVAHRLDRIAYLDTALDLLVRHFLDRIAVLEFQLFRDEHGADLQVARRALPPNPLEHLAPMLLPVLRQIEQKALVERSARSLR